MLDVSADQGIFTRSIRLVIADRQPIVLQGLKSLFAAQRDFEIVASCNTGTSCLEAIRNLGPDVALLADTLDLTISEILAIAKAEHLPTRLVFFTESETSDDLTAAIAAGACGAISKYTNPDTMLRSLRLMMTEHISAPPDRSQEPSTNGKGINGAKIEKMLELLTDRESQIVQLVSEGLSNKEIARQLNVSQGTVKVHLHNIFQKLEISNRTVLATIALLQRPAGLGTFALVALASAILSDVKVSEASDSLLDDDSTADNDLEHPVFEVWKKAILRHTIVVDSGETAALTQRGFNKVSQAPNSAAAEQAALSSFGRGYGPIGSSTPCLFVSPLLQLLNSSQAGSPIAQLHLSPPAFASKPITSQGGYGAFTMTAASALIYTLDNSDAAAQALDQGGTLIDNSTIASMDGATQLATITPHGASDRGSNDVGNPAPETIAHASHPPLALETLAHQGLTADESQIVDGGGDGDTRNGNDIIISGHRGDPPTGGSGDDAFVFPSAKDSNAAQFDTITDLISGADKINLAALGALAFLHLTSTSTSVPPHTVAWIYNPTTNETIVYVNPTDRTLDIGDSDLLEIHLQGVVSVAESDFGHEPDAASVAAALQGIDPELLLAAAGDETALTTGSADASTGAETSESTGETAGIWTIAADDGFRFQFARDRIGSNVSSKHTSFGDDSPYATEASSDGAVTEPASVSSIEPAQSTASVTTEENPAFKNEPAHANAGAATTDHGSANVAAALESFELAMPGAAIVTPVAVAETVEPGVEPAETADSPGNSAGQGNSQHAPNAAKASAAEQTEPGVAAGHGNPEPPPHSAAAGKIKHVELADTGDAPGNSAGHGTSQHASKAAKASAAEPEPGVAAGHGNPEPPPHSAAAGKTKDVETAETGDSPGNSAGHGNSQHASKPAKASATEPEPGATPGHGNAEPPPHSAAASKTKHVELADTGDAPGNSAGHGNSQHASKPAKASATEPEPGATPGHGNAEPPPHSAAASKIKHVELADAGDSPGNSAGHGNSQHASQSAAANASAAAAMAEPVATPGHGNPEPPPHSAAASKIEHVELADSPGNSAGHGNSQHASQAAAANASAADAIAEPVATPGHDKPEPPSHSATASKMEAAEPIETGDSPGNSAGHGNSQHASQAATANASAADAIAEPVATPGHDKPEPPSHSASASKMETAEPIETGVSDGDSAGHGNSQHAPQSAAANASAAAPPAELASGMSGTASDTAFHFKDQSAPPTATVELQELDGSPARPKHGEVAAILEVGPPAVEDHAADHANNGHHHATGHGSHELLV